jgi:hypothetical protein
MDAKHVFYLADFLNGENKFSFSHSSCFYQSFSFQQLNSYSSFLFIPPEKRPRQVSIFALLMFQQIQSRFCHKYNLVQGIYLKHNIELYSRVSDATSSHMIQFEI